MADKLPGISLSESDFISMLQGFVSKGDIKKKVDVEVNGSKEIEKLANNFEKLNSIRTDQLTSQLEKISTLLSVRFKGVNLNQFTSKLIRAFQDPTKNAEELSSTINDVYKNLTTLASIDNSGSFVGFSESEIRKAIQKQQKVLELQKQFESEYSNASTKTKKQKPVDIITRARVEKIQKQSSSDVATSLGVDSSKINVKNGDDTLLQTYQQTADLLAKMVSEKKEYNKLNKANVGDYLKQEQDILSVFQQLQDIEKQISEKFGISSKDFLSNQFKGDNGEFDFVKNAEQAVKTYVTTMTSSTKRALQEAQAKLSKQLNDAATKSVDRLGTANEKVGKTSERLGGSVPGSKSGTTVQVGTEIGESVATGMKTAEVATESATDRIKEYIVSIEDSIDEINRLQNIIDKGGLSDKEEDALLQKQAFHLANINRLNANKEQKELIESDALANAGHTFGLIKSGEFGQKAQEMLSQITSFTDSMQSIINRWVIYNKKRITDDTPEQLMVANDETGFVLEGKNTQVGGIPLSAIKGVLHNSKDQGNSIIHSHPDEQVAAFSFDDIQAAIGQKVKGIIHQYVVSLNDISFLDVSQFTDEQLSSIVEQFKQNAYFSAGNGSYLDSIKAFETINTSIDLYIDNILSDLRSFLGSDSEKVDFSSLKLSIQNAIKEEGIKDVDDFAAVAQESISKVLDQKKIEYDLNDLEYKVTNPTTSKILQSFSESELLKAIQSVVPNIDLSSVYKRTTLEDYNSGKSLLPSKIEDVKTDISVNSNDAEEKIKSLEASIQSLREELQRFKDTGVEPEGISELQTKLESAEQHIRSLSDELSLLYEHSVSESDYSRLEEELALAKANAEDLRESLVQVKSELEQSKIEAPLDSDALDKKVTELQYLHDKVRTIFDGSDGIVNEDMTYSEKFNSSEVQRMIELLNQLSDAELRATGVMPDDEDSYNTFRYNLQAEVDAIKETQEMLQQAYDTGNYDGFDASEIDVSIWNRLEHIYEMAQEVTNQFDSKLTPAVREFLGLIEGEIGSENMVEALGVQDIDSYVNDIISGAKTAKEAFADFENSFGWDTARFDSLIPIEVPQELKGLHDSLFSDVENRIKSAEQAAAEFNAELLKLSTSRDVNGSADQSAQSDIQAAEAAEQRAQANEHLAESEKKVDAAESSNTGTQGTPGQTDASVTESAIDAEMSKLDQLKNKIATEIPQAIGIKNNAFRDEQSVVESVIGAEVEALTKLEGGLKGVTDAAKNKTKAFQEKAQGQKTSDNTKTNTGKTQTDDKKQKSEQDIRNEQDTQMLKEYNVALDEYLKLEQQRVNLLKQKGNVELSQAQQDRQVTAINKMTAIQKKWNETQQHSVELQDKFDSALKRSNDEQQRLATQYKANFNDRLKADIKYSGRMTTYNTLLNESQLRPDAFSGAMDEMKKKVSELQSYFPINPTDTDSINRVHKLSDEIEQMAKEIRANPEYKNAKDTAQAALRKKAEQWAANNSAAINANPEGFERIRKAIADINTLSDQNEASRMLDEFIAKSNAAGKAGASFADTLKQRFKSLGAYLLSFASFYRVIGWIREAVQTVTQLDTAMVELKKVSDESAKSYSDFMKQSFDMADEVGTTSERIIQSTADWKRLGRSFEESKKLAQQSTVLMNVSEFENINDATEAMVSATQAYTDVASEDIIDKLNHVGNNFAVGTSELATGLQNAAAVLKTQGNDIDEALALLTAGNLIGQDISKASAGIRTISLRISGTEEAKDEIAEMGEDVDDFVVRTKSKTDQIIRDYTAVASNAHQGISVLDDNGNLRDTYSILLDISKIYKEIQEEDKKYGTNRAQALVETLAGKNRSNIASSILLNGDILESVYNASKNESKGSAQHELDTYLDSIEGKTAKLQNRLQELTSTAINSEFIKTVLDGLTKILELANSLVDTFGALPAVLGAVGGVLMQKNGWGILAGKNGQGGWINLLNGLFDKKPSTRLIEQTITKPLDEATSRVFQGLDPNSNFLQAVGEKTGANLFTLRNTDMFGPMLREMSDAEIQALKTGEAMSKMQTQVTLIPETASAAGSALSKIGSGITSIISSLGTMAVVMVASMAVQKLIELLYNLATAQKRAIEAGKEARDSISDTFDKYTEQSNSIKDLQDEYAKLSEGVSFSDGQVKNIKLSEEELNRFYEISNQLSEIAPELVTGYDNQGNAILNLGTTVDSVNSKFEQYLDLQQRIANGDIGNQLDTAFTGIQNQVAVYTDEYEKAKDSFEEAKQNLGESVDSKTQSSFSSLGVITNTGTNRNYISRDTKYITVSEEEFNAMNELLTDLQEKGASFAAWEPDPNTPGVRTFTVDLSNVSTKDLLKANRISSASRASEQKNKTLSEASINKYKMLIEKEYQEIVPAIQDYIATTPFLDGIGSDELEEQFRNGFTSIFSNMDYQSLSKDIEEAGGLQNFVDDFVTSMMATTDTRDAFKGLTELAKKQGEMTYPAIESARKEFYEIIKKAYTDEETGESLFTDQDLDLLFGYAIKDENDNIVSKYGQRLASAQQKLGLTGPAFSELFNGVDSQYADAALSEIEAMSMDKAESFAQSYQKIYDFLLPYLTGEKAKQKIQNTDTLSTLLNSESYKDSADDLSSDLSSLTGALETLRTEGSLTAEEMVNLQNSFPDLTEFTTEAIQTKAFEKLDEWIGKIREGMEGMSEEGKEQARTMIQNMIDQYGDLGVNMEQIHDTFINSLGLDLNTTAGHEEAKGKLSVFDQQVEELRSRLESEGLELDTHVLYTLVASDQFSGDADEIYNKYNDAKLNWEIILNQQNLERQIQRNQSVLDKEEAKRSLKQANGEILTKQDYETSFKSAKAIARMRGEELENATTQRDRIGRHDSVEYQNANLKVLEAEKNKLDADAEALRLEKESIEAETNVAQNVLKEADNAVSEAQNAVDKAEAEFGEGMADQKLYDDLAQATAERAAANVGLATVWRQVAERVKDEHPDWYNEFIGNAISAESSAQSDTESAKGYDNSESQKELNKLQEDATKIQRNLTLAEQNHQKVSKSTYNALIHNAKDQIKLLEKQQEGVKGNLSEWRKYQDQIDSLNDSIYEWDATSKSLIYDQASQLASTISTAMSESFSETGLTDDTINALKTAFSDLDGSKFDVSDAFYSTADGVKINTQALQELTEAEFELIGAPLANEIANVQAQLDANPGDSALQQKLENLMETNAKYFAQYEEMQKALSRNAAIDLAEGTSNAGANYDENYGRVKTYKEAREKGLIGTDDFKAWTSYLDVYGRDTLDAYDAVSGKIERYFTEEAQTGLGNFLTDMEKLGYAAQDADGYWQLTVDDYDAAAKDMQMGSEWFMDTLRKLEDFGMVHTYVSSLNEAQLKTRDVEEQIAEAMQTYGEMVKRGASEEELQKQIDHIHELEQAWSDVNTVRETWGETSEANKKKEFLGIEDQLKAAEKMYAEATTDAGRKQAEEYAKSVVEGWKYELDQEAGDGIFSLDKKSAEDYASRIKKVIGSIENPLSAEEMGISDENVQKYEDSLKTVQEKLQNGDLSSLQETLSGLTAEDLNNIDYSDGKYTEGFENAEAAVDSLRDSLGLAKEDTGLLIDVMTALGLIEGTTVESLPSKYEELEQFVASTSKGSGAGYQISADLSDQSLSELNTQMTELNQLEIDAQLDPNSEVYQQLQQLKDDTQLEIDARIQQNITDSGASTTQLKAWAQAGDYESIAKTVGIDVDSSELDQYIQQINSMPDSFDMSVHIDDEQFTQLVNAITDPWSMLITADTSEAEQQTEEFKQKTEKKPIIQTIQQKIQSFGNAVAGLFGGGQKAETTASMDTSGVQKGAKQAEKATKDVSKAKGTATADINIAPAMSKINQLRTALLSLSAIRPMPIVDQSSIGNAISRVQTLINKLNEAASKKNGLALGTAHSLGTTSLSRAYVGGRQNWTIGKNEKALVNEIGQESRVRDGVWELIPGGPHVEDLKANDIIFNAEQTADLIRTGKTARRGKLVAHANGTVNGMPAHATTSGIANGFKFQGTNSVVQQATGAAAAINSAVNAVGKASKSTKKNLDKFKKWLEKLFDWVEVRLDRIQRRIDLATANAETAIGNVDSNGNSIRGTISSNKNKNLTAAMNQIAKNVTEFDTTQLIFGKNGQVTGYKGGTDNTLLGDSVRGALKYQEQANKVANQAWKNGLFGKDKNKMNDIITRIQNGTIDISEYNEKIRAFIDAYKEWYDKSQDLVQSTAELKKQYNDLQQQKLDNIVDEFETLVGLSEAVKASSEATVEYYKAAGRAVGTEDEKELKKQRDRQGEITKTLTSQISAFKGELINAEEVFGKNSNEYREAQTKLEEMNKSLIESQATELELSKSIRELSFTIRGHFITRVKALVDKLGAIASLAEKRGTTSVYGISTRQTEDPYMEQTRYNNELILKYYEDIKDKQKEIQEFNWEVDSDQYEEAYNAITSDESAILSLLSANEDLKDSIRSLRWKPYEELNKELDDIVSDLQHVNSFIRDGEILDDDGQITERGYTQIALIAEQMDVAEKKIRNANAAMKKLEEERANDVISTEEYNEALDEQIKIIQDASSSLYDDQTKLADIYIDQITKENDILQDLIQSRKDALSAKKEYYDYDKTLRNKNKDIAQLQAQINALQGVTNDAAIAKRAKLQAELAEKQEDLNDTLYQHSIELQQEGYDTLSEDMQKALDKAVSAINGDFKILQDTSALMLQQLETNHVDEAEIIRGIVGENATTLHSSTNAVIDELSGEGGVKKLLEGLGVKLGDIATLDIAGAINSRTPDSAVSNINTVLSTIQNSLGEDIGDNLRKIEIALGSLYYSDEEIEKKKQENQEKLTNLNTQKDFTQTNINQLTKEIYSKNEQIADLKKKQEEINNNIEYYYSKASGAYKTADTLTARADALTKMSNMFSNAAEKYEYQRQANALLAQAEVERTEADKLMAQYTKQTERLKENRNTIKTLTSQVNDLKSQLDPLTEELNNLQKEIADVEEEGLALELHGSLTNGDTAKGNNNVGGNTNNNSEPKTEENIQADISRVDQVQPPAPAPAPASAPAPAPQVDPIIEAINSGKARSKTITAAEKKAHGDLWEYVAKKYGRSLTNAIIVKLAGLLGVKVSNKSKPTTAEKDKILKKLKAKKYAKGTKNISKDLLAWTNEDWNKIGSEMIVRPSDGAILTPLKAKDSVIPANLADNLFKWGAISPDKFITNPFVGKWSAEGGGSVTNSTDYTAAPQTVEMHFDSLFHIEGNVDESVMPRLENLGKSLVNDKDFQKNVIKFVTKDFVRESKKQGIR